MELSDFVKQQHSVCDFSSSESWVILSPIEQSIKRKIESVGTPLKDWDIQIYRGVLTGYNEAFIISTEKRNEILSNCQSEDERKRTAELIRPILRGRDIKRYSYDWADLWLINTHNGIKGVKERIHIEDYPAIKAHLDQYWDKISKRADKGDTPYNLRNCAYLDDFNKPKIVWIELTDESKFALSTDGIIPLNTVFFMVGKHIEYVLAIINSSLIHWYYLQTLGATSGVGTNRWLKYTVEQIPLPLLPEADNKYGQFKQLVINKQEEEINRKVFELYGLSEDEIKFIDSL